MKYILLSILFIQFESNLLAQNVTISEKNISLAKMMSLIRKQSGYFSSFGTGITGKGTKVSLVVKNAPLRVALDRLFYNLPFTYVIIEKVIVITDRNRKEKSELPVSIVIKGRVENEIGELLPGATISILNNSKGCITNSNGDFLLKGIANNSTLLISSVGYESQQYILNGQEVLQVKLKVASKGLDETVVIAYGETSQRLNTGNVYKVKGVEIINQPVSNFMGALVGRVPGMLVSQSNGLPGTAFKAEIRGRASIGSRLGIIPEQNVLILIDGVPFSANNNNLPTIPSGSALRAGRNSFDLIDPNDIESIEILKDADATAIYGSRGANGIILISTKKGKIGKTNFSFNYNTGIEQITRFPKMMSTAQYVQMRTDAIKNDGDVLNNFTAPDLTKWDTSRYTDFKKLFLGGTGKINNFHMQVAGGSKTIQYLFSGSLHRQTTIFSDDFVDNILYTHSSFNYKSRNNKLKSIVGVIISHDYNKSLYRDLTEYINTPPNAPSLYDSLGNLSWQENGYSFINPMFPFNQPYNAKTNNLLLNSNTSYRVFKDLVIKLNAGINNIGIKESVLQPRSSLNTFSSPGITGRSFFANTKLRSWIIEPQLEFERKISKGKLTCLVGATSQQVIYRNEYIAATGFKSDSFLTDLSYAAKVTSTPNNTDYKYAGIFARLSYNWLDKYILNITGRRDGSSRFGQGKQFGNFGAAGAAWIFSNESLIRKSLPFISYGKLRTSYGVTGSDQIGDYRYLDRWIQTQGSYQGISGLMPVQPTNPNYSWEVNKKLEAGLELGLLNKKLFVSTVYYRNRTGNQIIAAPLPATTGFERIQAVNYPIVVQNSGIEVAIQFNIKNSDKFEFNTRFISTLPHNKLVSFPNISGSLYVGNNLYIGQSLTSYNGFVYTGVDKTTGLFTFKDQNRNGIISYPDDYSYIGNLDPQYYGSIINNIKIKNWEINLLIEYKKQRAYNLLYKIYNNNPPGFLKANQPALLSNYWQKQNDKAYIQTLTASDSSPAYDAINTFLSSDGVFSDASYIRFKMVSISYNLSGNILQRLRLTNCRFYLSANNLAIITSFKGTDPETSDIYTIPPLRTIAAGIQINF